MQPPARGAPGSPQHELAAVRQVWSVVVHDLGRKSDGYMSQFTKALVVTPLADGRTWVILEPFSYDVGFEGSGDTIQVPVKFITDFASVPRLFWMFFPCWGKYGNAAVIHDYGYWTKQRPRAETDHIFLEGMEVLEVRLLTRYLLYWGVRLFGWWGWLQDARRRARRETMIAYRLPAKSTEKKDDVQAVASDGLNTQPGVLPQDGRAPRE
jgi:hypothetical protein